MLQSMGHAITGGGHGGGARGDGGQGPGRRDDHGCNTLTRPAAAGGARGASVGTWQAHEDGGCGCGKGQDCTIRGAQGLEAQGVGDEHAYAGKGSTSRGGEEPRNNHGGFWSYKETERCWICAVQELGYVVPG
jgi:hypothetical protein